MTAVRALLLMLAWSTTLSAQTTSDTSVIAALDPAISFVTVGGEWEHGATRGYYRVIVMSRGFEHVTSSVSLQWIVLSPDDISVVATSSLDPAFRLDSTYMDGYSVGLPIIRGEGARTVLRLEGTHAYSFRRAWWELELGAPGVWRLLNASRP